MITSNLLNRCRFAARSSLNWSASSRPFSSHDIAPLLLNPSNVTKDAIFVDASWHMPNSPRKAREEFLKKRLPQARFLDLDEVAKGHELGLKHMIPDPDVFAKFCGKHPICALVLVVIASPSLPAADISFHSRTFRDLEGFPSRPVTLDPCIRHRRANSPPPQV